MVAIAFGLGENCYPQRFIAYDATRAMRPHLAKLLVANLMSLVLALSVALYGLALPFPWRHPSSCLAFLHSIAVFDVFVAT